MNIGDSTTVTHTGEAIKRIDQPCERHHVIIDGNRAGGLACLHCEAFYPMAYPVPLELSIAIMKTWHRMHRHCSWQRARSTCPYDHSKRALAAARRMRPVDRSIPDRLLTRMQKRRLRAQSSMRIPGRASVAAFTYWLAHGLRWFASRGRP